MTFSDKSRYDRIFQQVTDKGGDSAIKFIKIFQNSQALSVSVGKNYAEDQLMYIFLDNLHQGGNYSSKIDIHQEELRREEICTDKKYLSI